MLNVDYKKNSSIGSDII